MAFEHQPFGKYLLLDRIALGGMAEIFKAKSVGAVGFEKLIAIKRILPHLSQNPEFITMLVDEAKIAVQLSHMNIAQVYDLGKVENDYFIAMEFIEGKDLRSVMRRLEEQKGRMSVENAVFIVVEICKGLDYAHRKKDQFGISSGIVHRDISPQNVLLSYEGEVKIVDFGIAKAARKVTETEAGVLKGKFAYMSPEQARGEEVDQRTDIFSTGIILYELLTGERLFQGENSIQSLEKIRKFHIEPPFLSPDIPSELEYILMQALHNDPHQRYQFANEFQVDLTKFLYSSALDFTSKNLSDLMSQLFKSELESKDEKRVGDDHIELDTETRLLIAEANQEVLVSREEEMTPAEFAERMVSDTKKQLQRERAGIPSPQELFEERPQKKMKRKVLTAVLLLVLIIIVYQISSPIAQVFRKIPQALSFLFTSDQKMPEEVVPVIQEDFTSSIYVESDPSGARVFLDQVELTELTPLRIKKVTPGVEHELKVQLQNYAQVIKTFSTEKGEILKLKVELKRERGSIFVSSSPAEADIFLNDKLLGKTPQEIEHVDANVDISIRVHKAGFQDYFEVVRLQPNGTRILQANLLKTPARLGGVQLVSVPPGAKIFLNGKEQKGKTPILLRDLDANREHTLLLRLRGYKDYTTRIRLTEGATKTVTAYFQTQPEDIR